MTVSMSQQQYDRWLLLLHQMPPSPPYLRAKVLRRLNRIGALPIRNSAYLLPDTPDHLEDFQWLKSEIVDGGGEAWIFRVAPVSWCDSEIIGRFSELRTQDYKQLLDTLNASPQDLQKSKRKFNVIRAIDFFRAPGREEVETLMQSMEQRARGVEPRKAPKPDLKGVAGRVWVTRRGVNVDRMASAWLIRRFIDPAATFRFVDAKEHVPAPGQVRFDMFEGEFTHEGDQCTFEVLLAHTSLNDAALEVIAQIVHDIDVKDDKFQRPETSGFSAMISGIVALNSGDEQRIEEGARLLEATYAALSVATDSRKLK
jgi:hypothetical protein